MGCVLIALILGADLFAMCIVWIVAMWAGMGFEEAGQAAALVGLIVAYIFHRSKDGK